MSNITIYLSLTPPNIPPTDNENPWYECGDNGAGYHYQFNSDSDGNWDKDSKAFKFPDGENDSITFCLDINTASMFDISALIVYQQPGQGQGRNQDKKTMTASEDIAITDYSNGPNILVLKDTNSKPGNNQRNGYFKVLVHHARDNNGNTLQKPVGFIACDPYWEDN